MSTDEKRAHDPDAPAEVHVELDSGSEIDIVGNAGAVEPYLEGPHSVEVHASGGVFEVEGRLGDDGLLVIPADVDLTIEANGRSLDLSGIRGSLDGEIGRIVVDVDVDVDVDIDELSVDVELADVGAP